VTTSSGHLTDGQAQRLLDEALRAGEASEVNAHAAACRRCAALVDSFRELSRALDRLPGPDLPDDFTAGVLQRVDRRERIAARERRTAVAVLGAALAAMLLAVLLGGNGAWGPTATRLAEQFGAASHALQVWVEVLPPVLGALRVPIAGVCAVLALAFFVALSRFIPSPRTEAT
jgi:anti-sigma factor RsiW